MSNGTKKSQIGGTVALKNLATLIDTNPVGRFAVFGRSPSGRRAKFMVAHDTIEKATEMAQLHAAELAARGHMDFTYYVVEIKARMGIEGGKYVSD